jgi:hypothetical protein
VISAPRAQLVERCPRPGEAQLPRTNSGEHFLDVVRGLPTLRAFNRGSAQIASIHGAELTGGRLLDPLLIGVALDASDAVRAGRVFATIREAVKALDGTPAGAAGNRQTPR